jgi:TonB family protein
MADAAGRSLASQDARRAIRDDERRRRLFGLLLTAAIAGLAHVALVLPALSFWLLHPSDSEVSKTQVRMVSLGKAAWEQNRKIDLEPAREPERKAPDEPERQVDPEDEPPPGQLVSLPRSRDERPEHADYVAQSNHQTERETVSRHQTQHYDNATHAPQVGVDDPDIIPEEAKTDSDVLVHATGTPGGPAGLGLAESGETGEDRQDGAGERTLAMEIPRVEAREARDLPEADEGTRSNQKQVDEVAATGHQLRLSLGRSLAESLRQGTSLMPKPGQGTRGGAGAAGLPNLAQLTPSLVELERVSGMPANDSLDEVETDAETRLNAWRWKHSTFFDRLKKGFNRNWRGVEVYRRHDPTRQVYGTQSLLTWLRVTIDREGNLVDINVLEGSGADFLDDEAVRTVSVTAPFTNPPPGLFGRGDTFTFRFGFEIRNNWREIDLNWRPY